MSYADLSILVSSFDQYAVCWEPFVHGLHRYWPGHPQNLYFITNSLDAPAGQAIKIGQDRGWAGNLHYALQHIPGEFIFYSQEDYWIQALVDDAQIGDYLRLLEQDQADYIRLYPAPGPDFPFAGDERLGVIASDSRYRASLQMALWRKSVLLKLLDVNESPWQFEVKGSLRSRAYADRFLCVRKRRYGIDYVFTAVVNGYWSENAYRYAKQENLQIPFDRLPQKTFWKRMQDGVRSKAYGIKKRIFK